MAANSQLVEPFPLFKTVISTDTIRQSVVQKSLKIFNNDATLQ
jgi:hypothetical protein